AQRCLSDPGGDSKGYKEPFLGEAEFNQRMERFKMASFQSSPTNTPSTSNQCPRTRSSFVSVIQQKLQGSTTPSSKEVSRIRQEREHELSQVPFQPIAENAWLKRSSSDSALTDENEPTDIQDDGPRSDVSTKTAGCSEIQKDDKFKPESCLENSMRGECTLDRDEESTESCKEGSQGLLTADSDVLTIKREQKDMELCSHDDDAAEQSKETQTVCIKEESDSGGSDGDKRALPTSFENEQNERAGLERNLENEAQPVVKPQGTLTEADGAQTSEVLEYAERMEGPEDHDSGIGACSVEIDKMETEKEKSEEEGEAKEEKSDESDKVDGIRDELLNFPPTGILSPLSKSVEAVVTPLVRFIPSKLPIVQSVTPGRSLILSNVIAPHYTLIDALGLVDCVQALNEEAGKLQTVINQTLQALNCCTDEEHGRGSLEEAEAEKLLLVSCILKEERSSESGEAAVEDSESISQQPCRGTVSITNIQLPLKVEYVCSSHSRAGRPSHYFFVLIRYGPCNIVATPLATAADAQNGDTISFPTSVAMKDIRSSFEIDVEVYSLVMLHISHVFVFAASAAAPPLITRRSSNFCLVGSHKIALASLGHSKFPLDKMKLDGKVRRLLGDEFQEKVPFLSPLEGNIYLQLESKSHSDIQHQGFLVRNFIYLIIYIFILKKNLMGVVFLTADGKHLSVTPLTGWRLDTNSCTQTDEGRSCFRCWFSADTKQERLDWMEKLNQALLDFQTWNRTQTESPQANTSSSGNLRESIL
uniref:Anillin, actin binding protein 2 n=1 Tax=Neolamprologus brichardi TaxID=32507 RepID=A0A3Q4GB26_NEOBR